MLKNKIILHCSATREGQDVSTETIRDWHVNGNGWRDIGYHWVIELDGTVHEGRHMGDSGAHTKGHNKEGIGICYVGGLAADGKTPKDTMTEMQETALRSLVSYCRYVYGAQIPLHGHNEFSAKACPSFDVVEKFGKDFCYPTLKPLPWEDLFT